MLYYPNAGGEVICKSRKPLNFVDVGLPKVIHHVTIPIWIKNTISERIPGIMFVQHVARLVGIPTGHSENEKKKRVKLQIQNDPLPREEIERYDTKAMGNCLGAL
jgi:hypothetical protein